MADALAARDEDALIVVDVQNDFVRGGALAVPDGEAILPLVNRLIGAFRAGRRDARTGIRPATLPSPPRILAQSRST